MESSRAEILGMPKYEFSLCHLCGELHANVEDGTCKLCKKLKGQY